MPSSRIPMTRVLGSTIAGCWAEVSVNTHIVPGCMPFSTHLLLSVSVIPEKMYLSFCMAMSHVLKILCPTAEREEMISCVYVSREEERVAVCFSKPVHVSLFT